MDSPQTSIKTIAILGGTGKEGKGLAYRWLKAGYKIIIGSRSFEKAETAAHEISSLDPKNSSSIIGLVNEEAAKNADLVVLTVPFQAHKDMLQALKPFLLGKILIDVTVPLVPPKVATVQMPEAGSATKEAQTILGEDVRVVAAFQNISYEHLLNDEPVNCDILVCGNSKEARQTVLGLISDAGLVGWDAGTAENAVVVEGMTSILIGLNKKYGVQDSGIKITGIPRPD